MLVLLNPRAGGGRAAERWSRVRHPLGERIGPFDLIVPTGPAETTDRVCEAVHAGETRFVAAGGDGTVNAVASALLSQTPGRYVLGAVGLGSSNDFHKPATSRIGRIPVRVDFDAAIPRDVLRIELDGTPRYALLSASVGVTAEANLRFNRPNRALGLLKRMWTDAAIAAAALGTIASRPVESLRLDGNASRPVTNLAVLLTPHCAGVLSYGTPLAPPPGSFTVAVLGDLGRTELLLVVARLAVGRFPEGPGARWHRAERLDVRAMHPVPVETDGEITTATELRFTLLPRRLHCCA